MFDLDQFIADCRAALAADRSHKLVQRSCRPCSIRSGRCSEGTGRTEACPAPKALSRAGSDDPQRDLGARQ